MLSPAYAFTAAAREISSHKLGGRNCAGVLEKSGGVPLEVSEESRRAAVFLSRYIMFSLWSLYHKKNVNMGSAGQTAVPYLLQQWSCRHPLWLKEHTQTYTHVEALLNCTSVQCLASSYAEWIFLFLPRALSFDPDLSPLFLLLFCWTVEKHKWRNQDLNIQTRAFQAPLHHNNTAANEIRTGLCRFSII